MPKIKYFFSILCIGLALGLTAGALVWQLDNRMIEQENGNV